MRAVLLVLTETLPTDIYKMSDRELLMAFFHAAADIKKLVAVNGKMRPDVAMEKGNKRRPPECKRDT